MVIVLGTELKGSYYIIKSCDRDGSWGRAAYQPAMLLPTVDHLRSFFPSFNLYPQWAFMENAGGSQVPHHVPSAISDYMARSYVQLGAGYEMANKADEVMRATHEFEELLMNAAAGPHDDPLGDGKVILGPSTSVLMEHLASSFVASGELGADDEVVVSQAAHEANKGPWVKAAKRVGATVRVWPIGVKTMETCPLDVLPSLLSDKTRVVALPHVSNLLGEVVPVREVVAVVRKLCPRASICVDGVAFAPHAAMDCQALGCDFYCYSTYKVFGPHLACLFGRKASLARLQGPNHFFIPDDAVPYKWELGCLPHELCAGRLAFKQYLNAVLGREEASEVDRPVVEQAFARIAEMEARLTDRVHEFLASQPEVTVYTRGPSAVRVPTISFTHARLASADIAARLHQRQIAVRHGHMYAYDLVRALGVRDVEDGVVRLSLLHYNTDAEVDRLLTALRDIFSS